MNLGDLVRLKDKKLINYQLGVITRVPDRLTLHGSFLIAPPADVLFVGGNLGRFYFYELELINESG